MIVESVIGNALVELDIREGTAWRKTAAACADTDPATVMNHAEGFTSTSSRVKNRAGTKNPDYIPSHFPAVDKPGLLDRYC